MPANRAYLAKIRWPEDKVPAKVSENGKAVKATTSAAGLTKAGWFYDVKDKVLYVKTTGTQKTNTELIVSY